MSTKEHNKINADGIKILTATSERIEESSNYSLSIFAHLAMS